MRIIREGTVVSERDGRGNDAQPKHWKGTCRSCGCMVDSVNDCCVSQVKAPKATTHFIHCPFCHNALVVEAYSLENEDDGDGHLLSDALHPLISFFRQ